MELDKLMTNLDSILKGRDITLPTKVRLVKAMIFPVVMYGCESWIIKKAECRRIDAFVIIIFFYFTILPVQVRCRIQEAWGWCTGEHELMLLNCGVGEDS